MSIEEGKMVKCPACGMTIDVFTTVCPACGTPIVGTAATDSSEAQKFAKELSDYDLEIAKLPPAPGLSATVPWPENTWLKIGWVLLNICFLGFPIALCILIPLLGKGDFNQPEKVKAQLIKNRSFSTPASNIEAVRIAGEQLMMLATEKYNANTAAWAKIWKAKAEECYKNGQRHEGDNKTLSQYYERVSTAYKKIQRKVYVVIGVIVVWAILAIAFFAKNGSESDRNRTRISPTPTVSSQKTPTPNNTTKNTDANVQGTYVGETGSVIVVHPDGKATYYWYGWDKLHEDNSWRIEEGKIVISLPVIGCEVSGDIVEPNKDTVFVSKSMSWDDERFVRIDAVDATRTMDECDALLKQYFGDEAEKAVERVRNAGMVSHTCDNVRFLFPKGTDIVDDSNGKKAVFSKELEVTIGEGKDTVADDVLLKNGETILDNFFNKSETGTKNQYGHGTVAGYQCIAADYTVDSKDIFIKMYIINEPERGKYVWLVAVATRRELFAEIDTVLKLASQASESGTKTNLDNVEMIGVSATVKELLDQYEEFVDKYVFFMSQYKDSNSLSMYKECLELELELLEWSNKVNELQMNASDNDAVYTLLVVYRSMTKLESVMK